MLKRLQVTVPTNAPDEYRGDDVYPGCWVDEVVKTLQESGEQYLQHQARNGAAVSRIRAEFKRAAQGEMRHHASYDPVGSTATVGARQFGPLVKQLLVGEVGTELELLLALSKAATRRALRSGAAPVLAPPPSPEGIPSQDSTAQTPAKAAAPESEPEVVSDAGNVERARLIVQEMWAQLDREGHGCVNMDEFLTWWPRDDSESRHRRDSGCAWWLTSVWRRTQPRFLKWLLTTVSVCIARRSHVSTSRSAQIKLMEMPARVVGGCSRRADQQAAHDQAHRHVSVSRHQNSHVAHRLVLPISAGLDSRCPQGPHSISA
jgi:hypothetical protein